jgi:hypothetical protein
MVWSRDWRDWLHSEKPPARACCLPERAARQSVLPAKAIEIFVRVPISSPVFF